jgi:hypothetical protein
VDIFHPPTGWGERVSGLRCELHAGDALLIPSCWWHEVESRTACHTVTFSWPHVGDAVLSCARHKHHTRMPLLKTVDVLKAFAQQSVCFLAASYPPSPGCSERTRCPREWRGFFAVGRTQGQAISLEGVDPEQPAI